ncbi:MAG: HlyC/CorC family transporter [Gammaproteobacteria bacterium]|nr:HlyC/CorC family transporter [Gammaproteobacteria bacterium]
MNDIPLLVLFALLFVLLLCSAFFSSSETGLMTINRHRVRHQARLGQRSAKLVQRLLDRPDRLIGTVLLGNNFINVLAASVATVIGLRLYGDDGIAIATGALTLLLLIFGEVTPKTMAALHPERVAFPAAYVLYPLMRLLWPLVLVVNFISNNLLKIFGVSPEDAAEHNISSEELRTIVAEAGALIPQRHQKMLLSILDLEKATVEDIMVPRNEIIGIDLSDPWTVIRDTLTESEHTRLPVYDGSIDQLKGVVHLRRLVGLAADDQLTPDSVLALAREPYFIPEGTPLNQQLLNFQNQKRRIGFVVDEYGDIQGLVTLEDILEEVVGEFTSDPATRMKNVYADADGSYRIAGNVTLRSLNRNLGWKLPVKGPKTINGLLLDHLQSIPQSGKRVSIGRYEFEIIEARSHAVKAVRVRATT